MFSTLTDQWFSCIDCDFPLRSNALCNFYLHFIYWLRGASAAIGMRKWAEVTGSIPLHFSENGNFIQKSKTNVVVVEYNNRLHQIFAMTKDESMSGNLPEIFGCNLSGLSHLHFTFYHRPVEVNSTNRGNAWTLLTYTKNWRRHGEAKYQIHFVQREARHVNEKRFGWIVQVLRSSITNTTQTCVHSAAAAAVYATCGLVSRVFTTEENFTLRFDIIFPLIVSQTVVVVIVIVLAFHFFFTLAVASRIEPSLRVSSPYCTAAALCIQCACISHRIYFVSPRRKWSTLRQTEREEKEKNNSECVWILCGTAARQFTCSCATIRIK